MLTQVSFLDVHAMRRMEPDLHTVVVSILDRSEEQHRPKHLGRFADHLCLTFEDVFEEVHGVCGFEKPWPPVMSDDEHARVVHQPGEHAPQLTDARRIVEFVRKHARSAQPVRLVVHCFGGISRSAAVAQWVSVVHWVPLVQAHGGTTCTDRANPRLLRLLDMAAARV